MCGQYNLLDEAWIKMSDGEQMGLLKVFESTDREIFLGGNPLEVIAVFKLLQAISQAAITCSEVELSMMDDDQYSKRIRDYLNTHRQSFYLYHDQNPFLQFTQVKAFKTVSYQALTPEFNEPSTNSTVIRTDQVLDGSEITDDMLAMRLILEMSFAFSGKKIDLKNSLSGSSYSNAPSGPGLSFFGALHNIITTENIVESLRLNHFTTDAFSMIGDNELMLDLKSTYKGGIGTAPWEKMPRHEKCEIAAELKTTLMGRLVPLSRFCLIDRESKQFHYSMGITHDGYKEGIFDPTQSVTNHSKEPKMIWVSTAKATWRQLPAVTSFLSSESSNRFTTHQLSIALPRIRAMGKTVAHLHSLGLEASLNMGETLVNGENDYIQTCLVLNPQQMGSCWYKNLTNLWGYIDYCAEQINLSTKKYCRAIGMVEQSKAQVKKVDHLFWSGINRIAKEAALTLSAAQDIDYANLEDFGETEVDKTAYKLKERIRKSALEAFGSLNPVGIKRLKAFSLNQPQLINKKSQ